MEEIEKLMKGYFAVFIHPCPLFVVQDTGFIKEDGHAAQFFAAFYIKQFGCAVICFLSEDGES